MGTRPGVSLEVDGAARSLLEDLREESVTFFVVDSSDDPTRVRDLFDSAVRSLECLADWDRREIGWQPEAHHPLGAFLWVYASYLTVNERLQLFDRVARTMADAGVQGRLIVVDGEPPD